MLYARSIPLNIALLLHALISLSRSSPSVQVARSWFVLCLLHSLTQKSKPDQKNYLCMVTTTVTIHPVSAPSELLVAMVAHCTLSLYLLRVMARGNILEDKFVARSQQNTPLLLRAIVFDGTRSPAEKKHESEVVCETAHEKGQLMIHGCPDSID